jgi:hypothetical protein
MNTVLSTAGLIAILIFLVIIAILKFKELMDYIEGDYEK